MTMMRIKKFNESTGHKLYDLQHIVMVKRSYDELIGKLGVIEEKSKNQDFCTIRMMSDNSHHEVNINSLYDVTMEALSLLNIN